MKELFNFSFVPEKSFLELPILKWVILLFVLTASIVTYLIVTHESLAYQPNAQGFNNAVTLFKVPLGILALIIPIVALLASNHRSVQTKKLIEITSEQNGFQNYYKHVEDFSEFASKLKQRIKHTPEIRNTIGLYKILFPKARFRDYSINTDLMNRLTVEADNVKTCFESIIEGNLDYKEVAFKLVETIDHIDKMYSLFDLHPYNSNTGSNMLIDRDNNERLFVRYKLINVYSYCDFIINCIVPIRALLEFDPNIVIPKSIKVISLLNYDSYENRSFSNLKDNELINGNTRAN